MSESLGVLWQEFLRLEVRINLLQRRSDAALAQQALLAPTRRRGREQAGRLHTVTAVPSEGTPPPVHPGRARAQRALAHSPRRAQRDDGRACRGAKGEAA